MALSEELCLRQGGGGLETGYDQMPHFKHFKTSPEIIRLAMMLYVWFLLSLRKVEDLLHEQGCP